MNLSINQALEQGVAAHKEGKLAVQKFELSDTPISKRYSMKCLYLQGEKTISYHKFDLLIKQVKANTVVGSIDLCSELKYGIKRSKPVFNDPLDYIVHTDSNTFCDFENIFIRTARDVLTDKSVFYKQQGHLTNGFQTAGNIFSQGKVAKTDNGNLVLSLSAQDCSFGQEKSQQSIIDVVTGSLCLFPASFHHYNIPFEDEEDHIVRAFDVIPKTPAN